MSLTEQRAGNRALEELRRLLVCPICHADLGGSMGCEGCGAQYERSGEIPVLLPEASRTAYKHQQAASHDDHPTPEFEIRRPAGAPALYGFFMEDKVRRATMGLSSLLRGATVVTLCGGSGMDAELLARLGCRVIATDISPGACARALERARRTGLPILPVVADAEQLPLKDKSVDIAYVHDGLHHLEQPLDGVAEMARVASAAASVNEPARAAVTALAVRRGIALEWEHSGNRVGRLLPDEVVAALRARGFREQHPHRYGMYYKHHPGAIMRLLSRGRLLPFAKAGFGVANALAGGVGNKMTVQAIRQDGGPGGVQAPSG
jgi:SAM-dependent methyltransferase